MTRIKTYPVCPLLYKLNSFPLSPDELNIFSAMLKIFMFLAVGLTVSDTE